MCSAEHGGAFVENNSQTWRHAADPPASGAAAEQDEQLAKNDWQFAKNNWGNDQLTINSQMLMRNSTLEGFPLSLIQADSLTTNVDGSSPSILPEPRGPTLQACIAPEAPTIRLGKDFFVSFLRLSGTADADLGRSQNISPVGTNLQAQDVYDGDMTFVLSRGLTIRIPNHQLVLSQGNVIAPNTSARELLINSNQDTDRTDLPLLGRPFLSSAYLFVDQGLGRFTIANANPNARDQRLIPGHFDTCFPPTPTPTANPPRCVTDVPPCGCRADIPACVTGSPHYAPPSWLPSSKPTQDSYTEYTSGNSGTSIAKAGLSAAISVPLVSVIIAIIIAAHIHFHRTRPTQPAPNRRKQGLQASLWPYFKPELSADAQPPHEMPLERNPAYVLAPYGVATKERRGEMRAEHESSIRGGLQPPSRAYFATRTGLTCRDV
ncbi:MAG: hypothetical protein Q9208_002359 [Pyrenodesmia sp. 3 TL-2023]